MKDSVKWTVVPVGDYLYIEANWDCLPEALTISGVSYRLETRVGLQYAGNVAIYKKV